jgi:hypothetical protein
MRFSDPRDKVVPALVAALKELTNPEFDATNPFFRNRPYVSLTKVLEHVKPPLAKHDMVVMQSLGVVGDLMVCTTTLLHVSGQWAEGDMPIGPNSPERKNRDGGENTVLKPGAQEWFGAGTYSRRGCLLALLGIVGDKDDDGNKGNGHQDAGIPENAWDKPEHPAAPRPAAQRQLTPAEIAEKEAMARRVAEVKAKQAAAAQGVTREVVDPETGEVTEEREVSANPPANRAPARPAGKAVRTAAGF